MNSLLNETTVERIPYFCSIFIYTFFEPIWPTMKQTEVPIQKTLPTYNLVTCEWKIRFWMKMILYIASGKRLHHSNNHII